LNQETYKKLISGQNTGLFASLLRFLLRVAATIFGLVIRIRNILYDKKIFKSHRVKAVVISIGNLTTGGTGKTPLVVWLSNYLTQNSRLKTQNYNCAILTRGYKTRATNIDEPEILRQNCPKAKVIVNPDRIAGATEAIEQYGAKVLIMDDGFQHRRLARDLNIVAIDATIPFGYGKILPAGLLREPVTSLKRADAVFITRCDQVGTIELDRLKQTIRQIKPDMVIACSTHVPVCIKYMNSCLDRNDSLEILKGRKVFAFCGIGNPEAFLDTIRSLSCELVGSKIYDDHHHYTLSDITEIHKLADSLKAELILTTQKDWTTAMCEIRNTKYEKFTYLAIEITFQTGVEKLTDLIEKTLAGTI
jgi:tetraacyldisaccharide 4'-kinase